MFHCRVLFVATLVYILCWPATAHTVRIANQGDILSLDPHSSSETTQLSTLGNVFEALTAFDKNLQLKPSLAIAWQQTGPTVWRFNLRQGVQFHDGTPLTANDVVFSFQRAQSASSDIRPLVADIGQVRALNTHTVEIHTHTPYPILPQVISLVYIMNKKWCEENQASEPVDRRKGIENAASFKTNGTGPYRVRERQPDVRTVFERSGNYWGSMEGNVREVVFIPIANGATRVAALLSGAVDLVEPVPLQDMARVKAHTNVQLLSGPELRTIFLGMDQKSDVLPHSSVRDANPFKDKRVRQAIYQAIDIVGIQKTVMHGLSTPSALMVGPGVNGFQSDIERLPYNVEAAQKLMVDAGYSNGFDLTMHCPNDRYVNDSRICQSVAANLAHIGIKINLQAETKGIYFSRVLRRDASFYLLGWMPSTYDAHNALHSLVACVQGSGAGQFNLGSYCNSEVDGLIKKIQTETDSAQRNAMIRQAFELHATDVGHVPLHQQSLVWGVAKKISLVQRADNFMVYQWMRVKN